MILRTLLIAASLATLSISLGCDSGPPEDATESTSAAEVEQEARELLEVTQDYGRSQQQMLERQAQESLDDLDAAIGKLQAKLKDASEDAKTGLEHALDRAEQARDDIATEMADMKDATADRWEQASRRISAAVEEAREARREVGRALTGTDTAMANRDEN